MATQNRAPTSDQTFTGTWTGTPGSRYQLVDDYPDASGADYLTHGTTAGGGTFGFSAFSVPITASVNSVAIRYYDRKNNVPSNNIGARITVGGTNYDANTHEPANGTWIARSDTWTLNPKSGVAWTVCDVNRLSRVLSVSAAISGLQFDIVCSNPETLAIEDSNFQFDYASLGGGTYRVLFWTEIETSISGPFMKVGSGTVGAITNVIGSDFYGNPVSVTISQIGTETSQLQYAGWRSTDASPVVDLSCLDIEVTWTPLTSGRRAKVSWSELEVPTNPRRGMVSWSEMEVPATSRRAQASWAELQIPLSNYIHFIITRGFGTGSLSAESVKFIIVGGGYLPLSDRKGQVSWVEFEVPLAPRRGRVSWAELEIPEGARRGEVSWAELETPPGARRARVSWSEVQVPDVSRRARVSWGEMETPTAPRRGRVSWIELELPNAARRGKVSWAELEAPEFQSRRGQVSWAEVEVPIAGSINFIPTHGFGTGWLDPESVKYIVTHGLFGAVTDRKAFVSWAEMEVPPGGRRGEVSWAELEVPTYANRQARVSWSELEVPTAPRRGLISWGELETPIGARRGRCSWVEMQVPTAPRIGQVSWSELEVPTAPRRGLVSWGELEAPTAPRRGWVSWAEIQVPVKARCLVSWTELEVGAMWQVSRFLTRVVHWLRRR